jgi:glucan 1,3-beta-glucosidase
MVSPSHVLLTKLSISNSKPVLIDHHEYQVFDNHVVSLQPWEHRQLVCNNAAIWSNSDKWLVVGEWSAAHTDCATYLNGFGIGARYDGTFPGSTFHGSCTRKNNVADWNDDARGDVRGFIEAQLETFEKHANGWFFWNFKTEGAHDWDAFALLDAGLFPQPLTDRKFGPICSN